MELKKGYKRTEAGVIPEDWEVKSYGEVFDFKSTATYSRNQLIEDGLIKYVHYGDIHTKWNHVLNIFQTDLPSISDDKLKTYDLIQEGDLIMADASEDYSGVGKSVEVRNLYNAKAIAGLHTFLLRDSKGVFITGLKGYLHLIPAVKKQFDQLATGMKVYGVSKNNLKTVFIPVPTLTEQTAIATALSDMDELIQGLEKLLEKKRAIKQGAMQTLLKPKEGWVVKRLGEIADDNKKWSFTGGPFGSNLKSSDYTESGVRIIQLQNIGDGTFIHDSEVFTSSEKADELLSCNIYPGDIILSKMGDPVARACIIPETHKRYLMCSDGIRLAVNERKYDPYFIFIFINAPTFRTLAENTSTGSTRKRIGLVQLKNLELIIPALEEQKFIAATMKTMDSEISGLEQKLSKYKMMKHGMMQELLTGRIRLI